MSDGPTGGAKEERTGFGRYALFLIKFAISASLVGYLLWRLDFRLPPLTGPVAALLALCVALLLVQPLVMSLRWWQLLRATGLTVTLANAIRFNWMAIFVNQFLPASLGGDAVRILLGRTRGLPVTTVTLTVLFDRGFAFLSLFVLILVLVPAVGELVDMQGIIGLAVAVCLIGFAGLALFRYLAPHLAALAAARPRTAFLQHYIMRISDLASDWKVMGLALGLSLGVHLLSFTALAAIAQCFGLDVPWLHLIAINALITLAHVLPISIAGWGVREGAAVLFFAGAGVDSSTALSISLLAGAAFATASLPGAVMWLLRKSE